MTKYGWLGGPGSSSEELIDSLVFLFYIEPCLFMEIISNNRVTVGVSYVLLCGNHVFCLAQLRGIIANKNGSTTTIVDGLIDMFVYFP